MIHRQGTYLQLYGLIGVCSPKERALPESFQIFFVDLLQLVFDILRI